MTRRALSLIGLLVLAGGCLGLPDTFGDMERQIDAVEVPDDYRLVAADRGGLRSGFAGAPLPFVAREFAGSWNGGGACDRAGAVAEPYGAKPDDPGSETCAFVFEVPAGFGARLAGVGRARGGRDHRHARGPVRPVLGRARRGARSPDIDR